MHVNHSAKCCVIVLSFLLAVPVLSLDTMAAIELHFVAKTNDVIGGKTLGIFNGRIALNESDEVAFRSAFPGGSGVFTQSSLLAGTGSVIGGKTLTGVDTVSVTMNDSGIAAFQGDFAGGSGVFTQNELIATDTSTIDGKTLFALSDRPAINNSGTVAFLGIFNDPGFASGIFTKTQKIIQTGDKIVRNLQEFTMGGFSVPSIAHDGRITFATANPTNGVFSHDGTIGGGSVIKVPGDSYGPGLTLSAANNNVSALNSSGTAAFQGLVSGSPSRRLLTNGSIIATPLDVIDGLTISGISTTEIPDINDFGSVIFRANTNLGNGFIFQGQRMILGPGTIVDGITLSGGINFAINNKGHIAVRVAYTGGSGIVLVVPEPASATFITLGGLALMARRRRR